MRSTNPISLGPTYSEEVAFGEVSGNKFIQLQGISDGVLGAGETYDLWPLAEDKVWLSSAEAMTVVSTSASDTAAGTGLQMIIIMGLDNNLVETQEVLALNGTVPVVASVAFKRINFVYALSVGTGGYNAGTVTLTSNITASTQAVMPIGYNRSMQTHYTLPANSDALAMQLTVSTGRNDEVIARAQVRDAATAGPFISFIPLQIYQTSTVAEELDIYIAPGSDVVYKIKATTNAPKVALYLSLIQRIIS